MGQDSDSRKSPGISEFAAGGVGAAAGGVAAAKFMGKDLGQKLVTESLNVWGSSREEYLKAHEHEAPKIPESMAPTEEEFQKFSKALKKNEAWVREQYDGKLGKEILARLEPHTRKLEQFSNPLTKPLLLFKEAKTSTKVTLGVIMAASSLVAGFLINKLRNPASDSVPDSHAGREDERIAAANTAVAGASMLR